MKLSLKREWLEYGLLLLVIGVLLWIGPGRIWEHRIDNGYPYGYLAADAFHHQARAAGIATLGNYRYEPIEYFTGDNPTFPGFYPPVFSQTGAVWSTLTGLESYHTAPGLTFFAALAGAALMYLIIRRFNPTVALLSLPLYPFMFLTQATVNGFTWGHWPQVTGLVFVVFIGWVVSQLSTRGWEVLLFWGVVGSIMTYTAHTIMAGLFLLIFLIVYTMKNGIKKGIALRLGLVGVAAGIATAWFLVIFKNVLLAVNPYKFNILTDWVGGGGILTGGDFGILWWVVLAGVVLATVSFVQLAKKNEGSYVPLLFSMVMLALGYTNYIGFEKRAFFIRLLWPVCLSLFFGLAIYSLGKLLLGLIGWRWSAPLALIVSLVLILVVLAKVPPIMTGPGVMNQGFWDSLVWLRDSTPKDARLVFMYGDGFIGDDLWNVERYHLRVLPEDYVAALQNGSVRRHYLSTINTETFAYCVVPMDLYKKNPISWGWTWNISYDYRLVRERDICSLDYLVFAKTSYQPILAQYNMYIATRLLEKPWITEAFSNEDMLILKNEKPGEACIENHQIEQ